MLLSALVILVIVEHLFFMILEMFFWKSAYARKAFRMSIEKAEASEALAKNQGLYNGFLAAGLIWSFFVGSEEFARLIQIFFLFCVVVAGVFGAATANKRIFFHSSNAGTRGTGFDPLLINFQNKNPRTKSFCSGAYGCKLEYCLII